MGYTNNITNISYYSYMYYCIFNPPKFQFAEKKHNFTTKVGYA